MRKFILILMALFITTGAPVVYAQDSDQAGGESADDGADEPEEDAEPECD